MLDQPYNLNCCFWFFGSDLPLFQETVLLDPYFKRSKNLMLLCIDKVTTWKQNLLFIWNVALVVVVGAGLAPTTATVLDISDILQFIDHGKSGSISQLIKDKLRDFQKLLKYFNGTTTSVSYLLLSAVVLLVIFVLYSKDLLVVILLLFIL